MFWYLPNGQMCRLIEKITTQIVEVKDPIVFRYVNGGIQVITKWGIEAEDKILND